MTAADVRRSRVARWWAVCLLAGSALLPVPALAQAMGGMAMPDKGERQAPATPVTGAAPAPDAVPAPDAEPADQSMAGMAMPAPGGAAMPGMAMSLGKGAWEQGSGTARLPGQDGAIDGPMLHAGGWMLMAHGYAWGVLTHQAGPRGDDGHFVTSMAMLMADRDAGAVHLQLRDMMSLDPALGPRGYPDLFAAGETAHGQALLDRQHPHDLFMELSVRADYRVDDGTTLFLYGGPVAEPALGPSAFMHRRSADLLPLAPITHHWFDSTHITYGVVTGGVAAEHWQVETSTFRGREPDERRWNIDPVSLDSWSVRASWTPSPHWAAQVSRGHLHSPEAQDPLADEDRTTASVQYASPALAATLGWAVKDKQPGRALPAWLAEANWSITRHHSLFGRVENVVNDELFPAATDPLHDRPFRVTKSEGGYAYRTPIVGPLGVALGGTLAAYAKPAALDAAYGRAPVSWTLFAKLSLGR